MSAKGKHGGRREGAGRKSKSEEQKLVEKLTPLSDEAHAGFKEAIKAREKWAIEMFFHYMYGKPLQRTENKHSITDGFKNLPAWMDES